MERSIRSVTLAIFVGLSTPLLAQSEGGLLLGVEAEKKFDKKLSVSVEAEMRTRNNFKTMDRWKFGISGSYKFAKWLKKAFAVVKGCVTPRGPRIPGLNGWRPPPRFA